jgi:hypothetical protein
VRPTQLPGVEYIFNFIETEAIVSHRLRNINVSVECEPLTLNFEGEEKL